MAGIGSASAPPGSTLTLQPTLASASEVSGYALGPGVLWVSRPAVLPWNCGTPEHPDNPSWWVSGSQEIRAVELAPPTAEPDKDLVPPGDTVTFTVVAEWGRGVQVWGGWSWIPDTTTNTSTFVGNCARLTTCRVVVRERGHVQVTRVVVENMEFVARSPIVEVENLQLSLVVSPTTVRPVVDGAGCFDAVGQRAYRTIYRSEEPDDALRCADRSQQRASRTDRVQVTVRGTFVPSGKAAANISVGLSGTPQDGEGGHAHDLGTGSRPKGTFFLANENVDQDGRPPGRDGAIVVKLSSAGDATVTYRTSGVSGAERVAARLQVTGAPEAGSAVVTIELPGLVELTNGGNVQHVGVRSEHPSSHWGTQGMVDALRVLADSFVRKFSTAGPLQVNDISVVPGGLFDLDTEWTSFSGHKEHRQGRNADVDASTVAQFTYIEQLWRALSPHPDPVLRHGGHRHLRY